jgi:hypothetical protein
MALYDVARNVTEPLRLGQDFDPDDSVFPSLTADGGAIAENGYVWRDGQAIRPVPLGEHRPVQQP